MVAHTAVAVAAEGHGEHGDVVSHFVMHDLQSRLAAHPSIAEDPGTALKESYLAVDSSLGEVKVHINAGCRRYGSMYIAVARSKLKVCAQYIRRRYSSIAVARSKLKVCTNTEYTS